MKKIRILLMFAFLITPVFYSTGQMVFAGQPPAQGGKPIEPCVATRSCEYGTPEGVRENQLAAAQMRNRRDQPPGAGPLNGGETDSQSNFSFYMSVLMMLGGIWALIALLRQRLANRSMKSSGRLAKKWKLAFKPQFALSAFALLFLTAIVGSMLTEPTAVSAEKPDSPKRPNKSNMIGSFNPSNKPVFKTAQAISGDGATQIGSPVFDAAGNRYVRGGFIGNLSIGSNNLQASRYFDAFVAKYDANGNPLWARQATGATSGITFFNSVEGATALAVDAGGNVYVGGSFVKTITFQGGANTPVTLNDNGAAGVNFEAFLAKYDTNGNLLWARGGNSGSPKNASDLETGQNGINQIVVDSAGNPYITGVFSGSNFFGSPTKNAGKRDTFLARLDPSNGAVVWKRMIGGADEDGATDMEIDAANNLYLIGNFDSDTLAFPTDPATVLTNADDSTNTYIAKFDSSGANLWVTGIDNESTVGGSQIAVDAAGEVFVTGYFYDSAEFGDTLLYEKEGEGVDMEESLGGYVAKMDTNGEFIWAEGFAGVGTNIALDAAGRVYIVGRFYDGGVFGYKSPNEEELASFGGEDIFVARYDSKGSFEWSKPIAGSGQEGTVMLGNSADPGSRTSNYYNPLGIGYNPARGTMFISGDFQNAIALDCQTLTNNGNVHAYIAEIGADFDKTSCRIWNGLDDDDNDFDSPDNWNGGVTPVAEDSVYAPYTGNDYDPPTFNPSKNIPLSSVSLADNRILTLEEDLHITDRLDLIGGFVDAEFYPVFLGEQGKTFATAEGLVLGTVQKQFPAGFTGSFVFPVGTADKKYFPEYSPVTLSNVSGAGSFSVTARRGAYSNPVENLPINRARRWWNLTNGGLQKADITFKYLETDINSEIENQYRAYRIPSGGGNAAQVDSAIDTTNKTVFVPNVSQFSDWTLAQPLAPTAAGVEISGRVFSPSGYGLPNGVVTLTDQNGRNRVVQTNGFGLFSFDDIPAGTTYIITVTSKRYEFAPQIVSVNDNVRGLVFTATN